MEIIEKNDKRFESFIKESKEKIIEVYDSIAEEWVSFFQRPFLKDITKIKVKKDKQVYVFKNIYDKYDSKFVFATKETFKLIDDREREKYVEYCKIEDFDSEKMIKIN